MSGTTKPRGDAKLKTLPDALQEQLWQYARRNTIEKTLAWLAEKHGVVSSARALSEFFSWYPRTALVRQSENFATSFEKTLRKLPELKITGEQASQLAEVAFEIQAAQDRDPALFLALQKGKANREKLRLEERRVALLEKKAAQADAAREIVNNSQLSEEEQAQQVRALFGMGS